MRSTFESGEVWWVGNWRTGRWWAGAIAGWTLFAMLMAGHAQFRFGGGRAFGDWLGTMLPFYWAWVPLTPIVVLAAAGSDFSEGHRSGSTFRLLAVGLLAVLLHGTIYSLFLVARGDPGGLGLILRTTFQRHGLGDLATIGAVAGGILLLAQHHRDRLREREAARTAIQASRLEAQLSAARLDALQMQLHPHFLFNALNSISVMVLKGAGTDAIRAIRQLGDLLRAALRTTGAQELPLADEIEFVERYLAIERLRFADRLQVEFALGPDTGAALVPRLILQPLVENAIVHGAGARGREGRIRVAVARANGSLRLEVWDNGPGGAARTPEGEGVGLANTRARLRELYGEAGALRVSPDPDGGTLAAICLPYHTDPGSHLEGAAR